MTRFANRYEARDLLGEGMMGQVWRVADTLDADRELALKVIKADGAATADQRLRFMAEFRAMARLAHPNTLAVHDYGELPDGNRFIAMELVPGEELSRRIARGPVPPAEAYPLIAQLLQALDFIHSRGYLHRDVKADNVRVTPDGTLKLMDFGLMSGMGVPATRQVTGTPGTMAPEAIQGGHLGPGVDLYAAGCLAYELLTGRLPFQGPVVEVLRAHVGAPPPPPRLHHPALERFVLRLLAKDPARRPASAGEALEELAALAGLRHARESLDQRASFLTTGELVGRDAALAELDAALHEAREGRGRAVWLSAPAGMGKSRLMGEAALRARLAGFLVLRGGAHDGGMAPYEALAAALREALPHGAPPAALGRVFPELGEAPGADVPAVAAAVTAWLGAIAARQPVLWLVDDLHWADAPSVEVLNAVAPALRERGVLLVAGYRGDETPAGSPVWRATEEGLAEPMCLGPLDAAAQGALLAAMLPGAAVPEAFAKAIDGAAGGNPFFLTELMRALLEDGHVARTAGVWGFPTDPAVLRPLGSIEATVRRRLQHLPAEARAVLEAAAVLGREFGLGLLAATADLPEGDLLAGLDELVARHLVQRLGEGRHRFGHDRVREVTEAGLDPARRRALHQRAGEALEAACADATPHAHDLARHFHHGAGGEKAYRWLMEAARQADRAGADGIALDRWREADRVLDGLPGPDQVARQLELWFLLGWNGAMHVPGAAQAALTRMAAAIDADPAGTRAALDARGITPAQVWRLLAASQGFSGRPTEALASADRVAALLAGLDDPLSRASRAYVRGGGLVAAGRIDEAIAAARDGVRGFEAAAPVPFFDASSYAGSYALQNARVFQGERPDEGLRDQARGLAGLYGDSEPFTVWYYFGLWAAWTGRAADARAYVEMTVQKARKVAAPPYPWVLYLRPYLLWQRGEHAAALEQVDRALIAHPHLRQSVMAFHHALALRGHLLRELKRGPEAQAVFDDLLAEGEARGAGLAVMLALHGRGMVHGAAGRPAEARADFRALHAMAAEGPLRNPLYQARAARGLGQAAMALGDWAEAAARLDEAMGIAGRQENLFLQAHLHRDRGRLALRRGDREAARAALGRAGDGFQALGNPHWLHAVTEDLAGLLDQPAARPGADPAGGAVELRWQLMRGML